jgi:hypothetical protein
MKSPVYTDAEKSPYGGGEGTGISPKKIQKNFEKPLDKFIDFVYNKITPKRC